VFYRRIKLKHDCASLTCTGTSTIHIKCYHFHFVTRFLHTIWEKAKHEKERKQNQKRKW